MIIEIKVPSWVVDFEASSIHSLIDKMYSKKCLFLSICGILFSDLSIRHDRVLYLLFVIVVCIIKFELFDPARPLSRLLCCLLSLARVSLLLPLACFSLFALPRSLALPNAPDDISSPDFLAFRGV